MNTQNNNFVRKYVLETGFELDEKDLIELEDLYLLDRDIVFMRAEWEIKELKQEIWLKNIMEEIIDLREEILV